MKKRPKIVRVSQIKNIVQKIIREQREPLDQIDIEDNEEAMELICRAARILKQLHSSINSSLIELKDAIDSANGEHIFDSLDHLVRLDKSDYITKHQEEIDSLINRAIDLWIDESGYDGRYDNVFNKVANAVGKAAARI